MSIRQIGLAVLATAAALLQSSNCGSAAAAAGETLRVGKDKRYTTPSQAARVAVDGAVVEIDAGVYPGDVCVWRANNLTIRGVGGKAHLQSGGTAAEGKGIWVINGSNVTVENIEFSGCAVRDRNGAGIRHQGNGLTVRNCYFHDNENGILGGGARDNDVVIEHSEFARNGHGDGQSHNLYITGARTLTLRYCYMHQAKIGHNVKSRAQTNYILYNRIADDESGTASYEIDLPDGGLAVVVGNLIQKSTHADNSTLLAYCLEKGKNPVKELYVVNNTFVTDRNGGTFVQVRGDPSVVRLVNNIFVGNARILAGNGEVQNNLVAKDPLFVDRLKGDYRLQKDSPAIDAGAAPGKAHDFDLAPKFQYVDPLKFVKRTVMGPLDIGAYEYTVNSSPSGPMKHKK